MNFHFQWHCCNFQFNIALQNVQSKSPPTATFRKPLNWFPIFEFTRRFSLSIAIGTEYFCHYVHRWLYGFSALNFKFCFFLLSINGVKLTKYALKLFKRSHSIYRIQIKFFMPVVCKFEFSVIHAYSCLLLSKYSVFSEWKTLIAEIRQPRLIWICQRTPSNVIFFFFILNCWIWFASRGFECMSIITDILYSAYVRFPNEKFDRCNIIMSNAVFYAHIPTPKIRYDRRFPIFINFVIKINKRVETKRKTVQRCYLSTRQRFLCRSSHLFHLRKKFA